MARRGKMTWQEEGVKTMLQTELAALRSCRKNLRTAQVCKEAQTH